MKRILFISIIIIAGLLQTTILNYVRIFNIKPDLLLISMIIASLSFESAWAISLSIFAGIVKDIFSVNLFGINTLLFFSWSYLIIKLSRKITFDSNYIRILLIFFIAILNNIAIRLIFIFLGHFISWGIFLRIMFIESIYTALTLSVILKFTHPSLISR